MQNKFSISLSGIFILVCLMLPTQLMGQTDKKSNDPALGNSEPFIEEKTHGVVDWGNQYIEAFGESVIDTVRFKNLTQARAMARRGAVVVAQRNLLEIINGVRVTGETTVEEMVTTSDKITTRIDGIIKGAQMIGTPVEEDGLITVTLRVKLYEDNSLASAVHTELPQVKDSVQTTVTDTSAVNSKASKNEPTADEGSLLFTLNGKNYSPSLFPIIEDTKGNELLDFAKVLDPKSADYPKIIKNAESLIKEYAKDKNIKIVDVLEAADGKIIVDTVKQKINWDKIGKTATSVGKVLFALL